VKIYLLRHAIAEARDPKRYPDDGERPLTRDGRLRMRVAARGMKALGIELDYLLTSPLTRARQTAAIVAREMRPGPRPKVLGALTHGGRTQEILAGIPKVADSGAVMLVGHEPDLSRLAGDLLLPPLQKSGLHLVLRKGGLIRIDFDEAPQAGAGRLVMLVPPRILRRM